MRPFWVQRSPAARWPLGFGHYANRSLRNLGRPAVDIVMPAYSYANRALKSLPIVTIRNPVLYPAELRGQPKNPIRSNGYRWEPAQRQQFANCDLRGPWAPLPFTLGTAEDKCAVLLGAGQR